MKSTHYPFIQNTFIDKIYFYLKFIIFVFITIWLIVIKVIFGIILPKYSIHIPRFFHKILLWLINIKVKTEGNICIQNKGMIYVSNHLSYIDIPVLGSLLAAKFVAKLEVSKWPIIGNFAKIGNTIFIKRLKNDLLKEKNIIEQEIASGEKVILFPEGTTSDGIRVLNFKSSLLSSVESQDSFIQPIVINYEGINGLPLNRGLKPVIAWYGDMDLKPHLLNLLKIFSITARVCFLEPINSKDFKNRKNMTLSLQNVIGDCYSDKINDKKI